MNFTTKIIDGIKYKPCTKCGELKNYEECFYDKGDRKQCACKQCYNRYRDERRKRDPEKWKNRLKNKRLKQRFGITLDIYNQMFEQQNGVCFICQQNTNNIHSIGVDHNHDTGQIRKLLCSQCNTGLGHTKESYTICLKFIWYLYIHNNNIELSFEDFMKGDYMSDIIKEHVR